MRENRSSGSEGGVALIPPSLPLSKAGAPSSAPVQCGKPLGLCQASGTLESAVSPHSTNPFVSFVCSCESCGLESAGYWVWASDRTRLCGRA